MLLYDTAQCYDGIWIQSVVTVKVQNPFPTCVRNGGVDGAADAKIHLVRADEVLKLCCSDHFLQSQCVDIRIVINQQKFQEGVG